MVVGDDVIGTDLYLFLRTLREIRVNHPHQHKFMGFIAKSVLVFDSRVSFYNIQDSSKEDMDRGNSSNGDAVSFGRRIES